MHFTRVRTAWLGRVVALALHAIDEAATGFLDVYNPTVRALHERLGWFPMPEFPFDVWATGLAALVLGLTVLTPLVDRGAGAPAVALRWGPARRSKAGQTFARCRNSSATPM